MIFAELLLFVVANVKDEHGVAVSLLLFFLGRFIESVTEGGIGLWCIDVKAGDNVADNGGLGVGGFDAIHDAHFAAAVTVLVVYAESNGVGVGFGGCGGDKFGCGGIGGEWFVGILPKME